MTRRRRSLLINGLLVVVLLGAGVAGYLVFFGSSSSAQPTAARTAAAANRDVSETVTASGTVQSSFSAAASFGASGTVTEINVKVGDVVTKGQQLAKLDPTQAQLQVDIAQGNLSVDPGFVQCQVICVIPYVLASTSALVNAGDDAPGYGVGTLDLAMQTRVGGAHVDIGAYENQDVIFRDGFAP